MSVVSDENEVTCIGSLGTERRGDNAVDEEVNAGLEDDTFET